MGSCSNDSSRDREKRIGSFYFHSCHSLDHVCHLGYRATHKLTWIRPNKITTSPFPRAFVLLLQQSYGRPCSFVSFFFCLFFLKFSLRWARGNSLAKGISPSSPSSHALRFLHCAAHFKKISQQQVRVALTVNFTFEFTNDLLKLKLPFFFINCKMI